MRVALGLRTSKYAVTFPCGRGAEGEADDEGLEEGLMLGETETLSDEDGDTDGDSEGLTLGEIDGETELLGETDNDALLLGD